MERVDRGERCDDGEEGRKEGGGSVNHGRRVIKGEKNNVGDRSKTRREGGREERTEEGNN